MAEVQKTHINAYTNALQDAVVKARQALTELEDAGNVLVNRLNEEISTETTDDRTKEEKKDTEKKNVDSSDKKTDTKKTSVRQENNSTGKTGAGAFDNTIN